MTRRVLIVEDDLLIAELERDYLAAEGYEADIAADGLKALSFFHRTEYDMILLDVMLPEIDGFKLCRMMRGEKDVPIMMVTARKDDIDKIRGLGLGADDYMVKPFSPAEMTARVKAHINAYERLTGGKKDRHRAEINIRDLRIVTGSRRVYVGEKEIILANKEYEILLLLAENPDIVFSKDAIFEKVWGVDAMGDSATVAVHVNRIREKMERDVSDPQYIETVWGAGYRLRV